MAATEQLVKTILPLPPAAVYAIFVGATAAWAGLHRLQWQDKPRAVRWSLAASRLVLLAAAMFALAQASQSWLILTTRWPAWPILAAGAVAVEALIALYALERRIVSRRLGRWLLGLRLALVLLAVAMLLQPVRASERVQKLRKTVAVLLDESASMQIKDTRLSPVEKLRLAELLSPQAPRRHSRIEKLARSLAEVRQLLGVQIDSLAPLRDQPAASRQKLLEGLREPVDQALARSLEKINADQEEVGKALDGKLRLDEPTRVSLTDIKAKLATLVGDRLREAAGLTNEKQTSYLADRCEKLTEDLRQAVGAIAQVQPRIDSLAQSVDQAFYRSLSDDQRRQVGELCEGTRLQMVRRLLQAAETLPGEKRPSSLLERLVRQYDVEFYSFAAGASRLNVRQFLEDRIPASQASLEESRQQTDFAAALQKISTDLAEKPLAGVVLVTDGRHNAKGSLESAARTLGLQHVPIDTLLIGAQKPPVDAAIVAVDAPETVYLKDKLYVAAEIKLDGLEGKSVKVALFDGERQVDFKTIPVPGDSSAAVQGGSYRTNVQLSDTPAAKGLHSYRLELEKFEGESFTGNNTCPLTVSVTDDQTRLLLIEGRPRWEFRYLKNLFTGRDRSVGLQYVLFEPDAVAEQPPLPLLPASAARSQESPEATALPDSEAEWLKFDVIILGDVAPTHLRPQDQEAIRKFVADRGGTLIVIGGPANMPHAYAHTPLETMLPVTFKPLEGAVPASPDPVFRIALTAEGKQSAIMRQKVEGPENEQLWQGLPDIYWRYPVVDSKPAATVLAYALPPSPPPFITASQPAGAREGDSTGDLVRQRRQFERSRPLVAVQTVALGRVLFMGFDQTWRMRYQVGDTYHHKFWGQVLRWATAGKLPAGTNLAKIGTDRARYAPHTRITARAKLLKEDLSPLVTEEVAVNVTLAGQPVLRKKLRYEPLSPGIYSADLGELPGGLYRIELECPQMRREKGAATGPVATEFSVDPYTPVEQIDLGCDRTVPTMLANATGGTVFEAPQASAVLQTLGGSVYERTDRRELLCWASWPLLILMVLLATGEWLLRKKAGLA